MFLKKTGQPHRVIYVTNSYQKVTQNKDNYDVLTGIKGPYAVETFATAVAAFGALDGTIVVEKAVAITADTIVGSNISIDIRKGGSFAVSTTKTLTIGGSLAVNGQPFGTVFTGLGTVVSTSKGVFQEIESGIGMVVGGSAQDILAESATKNFPIGTRRVVDDRVFRYCKAGTNLREQIPGICAMSQIECNTHAVESLAGTYEVTILDTVARVEDWYAGGYYWGMLYAPATTGIGPIYRIKSSEESSGISVKLTLEKPLVRTIAASNWSTTWANIYSNIQCAILPKASMVCLPLIQVTSGKYFWGQTWGPCFGHCGYSPGSKNYDREFYFKADHYGFLPGSEIDFSTDIIPQRVGFLLPDTAVVGTDNLFMLQLAP